MMLINPMLLFFLFGHKGHQPSRGSCRPKEGQALCVRNMRLRNLRVVGTALPCGRRLLAKQLAQPSSANTTAKMPMCPRRSRLFCWLMALGLLANLQCYAGFLQFPRAGWKPNCSAWRVARDVALERLRACGPEKSQADEDGFAKEARFLWRSEAGRLRALQVLGERFGGQYDVSRMDEAWWKAHVKDQKSKLEVTCRHCGHRSRSTWVQGLQQGTAPGCFCNGGVPWSSPAGRARCLEMIWERYGGQYDVRRIDEAWWKAHVKSAFSKLDVTCRRCGHRSNSTRLNDLRKGCAPGCFCNGAVPWSSPAGRARCLEMIWERFGGQYDVRRMDEAWWKAHVKGRDSKLDVTCRHCGHRSRSTSLDNLQRGRSPACLCAKRTEGKLMRWLAQNFSQLNVTSQVGGCTSPASNRTLPFDFGLNNDAILIELDGNIGHFGVGWGGSEDDKGVPQRDHFKERWALRNGKTVVRLLQEDVYLDSWDWKGFLAAAVRQSIRNSCPCVITQEAVQYKSGVYRELRGVRCQVGHFQSSRGAPIPYLTRHVIKT